MRSPRFLTASLGALLIHSSASAAIIAGNLNIIQNDVGNETTSVSGSFGFSQGNISYVPASSSRGDFALRFDGATPADDVANGIMIVSIAENGRSNEGPATSVPPATDNSIGAGPGYATPAIQPLGGGYGSSINASTSSVTNVGAGKEWNANQGVAYFKYTEFVGGWIANPATNNGVMDTIVSGSPGLTLSSGTSNTAGSHIFDNTSASGTYSVNLTSFTAPGSGQAASSQSGILIVTGGKNEANHALSRANADGTFDIFVRSSDTANLENDGAAFVYIPTGQAGIAAMGRVDGTGLVTVGSGDFSVTKGGTGQWLITTTGCDPTNSTLLLSAEGGTSLNNDNIYSYSYNEATKQWVVEGRDIPNPSLVLDPTLQNIGSEPAFSFAVVSNVPEPATVFLSLSGLCLLLLRRRK